MVARRSEGGMLQRRPTPKRPGSLVLSDTGSEFIEKEGTAAEQTGKANALLREEYVRHVVSTGEMSRLKHLGAVQPRGGLHLGSALGQQPLTPRGVTPQGRGEECFAISMFAEGRQALYEGAAESLAELLKLKLLPQIWWKIRGTQGHRRVRRYRRIFVMKKYRIHQAFRVSFGQPFHADLISPGRACSWRAPSAGRQQCENEMEKALVHRQFSPNVTDKRTECRKTWRGKPSEETNYEQERGVRQNGSRIQKQEGGLNPPMRTSGLIGGGELLQP